MFTRLFILFLTTLPLRSMEDDVSKWFYRAWQTEDGLPDNSVSAITQSPDGYLWIGTNSGVIRFNGTDFTPLPLRREIPGLPSRQVHSMYLDSGGQLWMGMERGPVIRVGPTSFDSFDKSDGIFKKRTTGITEDPKGNIWITYTSSVCKIEGQKVTRFTRQPKQGNIPTSDHSSVARDSNGQIWMTSDSTLGRLGDEGFQQVKTFAESSLQIAAARESGLWVAHGSTLSHFKNDGQISPIADLPSDISVKALIEDSQGAIWIGTQKNGLLRFHEKKIEHIATSHPWISCITEDQEGNIWAGTIGGGLNLILPRAVRFIDSSNGLPFSSVRSTSSDPSGRIWATSLNGKLGYHENQQWHLFSNFPRETLATCVTADKNGKIWVGTHKQGLLKIVDQQTVAFTGQDYLAAKLIRSILPAKNGDLWIATTNPDQLHLLRDEKFLTLEKPIAFGAIRALSENENGPIWVGTADGHLFKIENDQLTDQSDLDGPTNDSIRTLHSTPDGSLWIGYAGDGLGHLKDGVYRKFTTEDGLHDDYLSQIEHDNHGHLWIAANRGLFQISLTNLLSDSVHRHCRIYGRNNGLPSIQPSRDYAPSSARGQDGKLYFSTHSGLIEVTPNDPRNNPLPPPVVLEKVSLDGNPIALFKTRSMLSPELDSRTTDLSKPDQKLVIPPDHDNLIVSFAALNFAFPENTLIRYRLHPVDEKWQEVEKQRRITFPRLPAGNYRLQVIASNGSGDWTKEGASINLIVKPFFWETWWFKLLTGSLTALIAGGFVFLSLKRKHQHQLRSLTARQALEQERSRIARDIHDDLGASLTHIALLSQTAPHPEDTSSKSAFDNIQSTARHLMRSMDGVVWAINPEHDSFDELANYLSSYAQEFLSAANIRCRLVFPVDLPENQLTAQLRHNLLLAFKEALNNVVKYAEATEVRISLQAESGFFTLKIQDNGIGIDPDAPADPDRSHAGNGMANMESRMKEIDGTCTFQSDPDQGTTIEFNVPFCH